MGLSLSPAPSRSSIERPWRILVVDDEENLNWSIVTSLRKEHYEVEGTCSAEEAIRLLWAKDFDVIISDIKMPGMDGFELLSWVRAHRPGLRIMMMTAFGSVLVQAQALQHGAVTYLEKPFDLRVLKEELHRLLHRTGFAVNLEAFDLLDIVQIINMTRKSIALRVEIGVAGEGLLCFIDGELIWAEFGELRGEEAFFAIAAHKTGILVEEPHIQDSSLQEGGVSQPASKAQSNVALPIARLIMQALQYRDKYATGAGHASASSPSTSTAPAEEAPALDFPASSLAQSDGDTMLADAMGPDPLATETATSGEAAEERDTWQDLLAPSPSSSAHTVQEQMNTLMQVLTSIGSEVPGFKAVALLRSDGMIVAQYSIAPIDLTGPGGYLATAVRSVLRALLAGEWGDYEDTVITGTTHYVLLRRLPPSAKTTDLFQLLITSRDSNLGLCRMMLRIWEQPLVAAL
jgi:CheY-like chemotaxis protein/predicted regulator of Ras-like GTPase activity (Roadblock/LC7/MglB family)